TRLMIIALGFLLFLPPVVEAAIGPRIPIPKGLPAEVALELLKRMMDTAQELEKGFVPNKADVKIHQVNKSSLVFSVPVDVEMTQSESDSLFGLDLPFSKIQV